MQTYHAGAWRFIEPLAPRLRPFDLHINLFNTKSLPYQCSSFNGAGGGRRAPEFEPFAKITQVEPENEKVEIKNKQKGNSKTQNKKLTLTIQRFSNHIKFINYIPTHEIITYRHLFAYGFYVE